MAPRARPAAGGRHARAKRALNALAARAALLAGLAAAPLLAHGGAVSRPYCDTHARLTAAQQGRLLAFAALARRELEAAPGRVAIVARSGLDLSRFRIRYTHAGVSLAASANGPWSVRQLYYACDEREPRLFDQGLAGFVQGTEDPTRGFLSIVLLPARAGAALEKVALDAGQALALLGRAYSANAHPFSTRYQNCNQWLAELLALAWGARAPTREDAQAWLAARGYAPAPVQDVAPWMLAAAAFVPWLHTDDHPPEDLQATRVRTSLPAAIEDFVRAQWPGAERIELCHDGARAVLRRGWAPVAEDCRPAEGDRVIELDGAPAGAG